MRTPALLAAVPLIVGVVCGLRWPESAWVEVCLPAVVVSLPWAVWKRLEPPVVGVFFAAAFGLVGYELGGGRQAAALDASLLFWFERQSGAEVVRVGPVVVEGRLRGDARPTRYGASLELEVERVGQAARSEDVQGGLRLSVGGALVGEQLEAWRAGRLARLSATLRPSDAFLNPGRPDEARRRALRGTPLLGSVKSALLVDVLWPGGAQAEAAGETRRWVCREIDREVGRYGVRPAAIVTAVLIGDRAGLDDETTPRLQESGIYQVIAIFGGNIAILATCLLVVGRAGGVGPRVLAFAVIGLLGAYAFVVGREASVARATTAAVLWLAGGLLDHRAAALGVLATTAVLVVLWSPLSVVDTGFLLTFGATLALVLSAARMTVWVLDRLAPGDGLRRRWLRSPVAVLAATVCAEAALLPVGVVFFYRATFAGLGLNLLAIPLMTVVQLAGLATLVAAPLSGPLAGAAGFVAHLAAEGLVESARLVDWLPALVHRVPPPSPLTLVVYYVALGGCLLPALSRWRAEAGAALVLAALVILRAPVALSAPGPPTAPLRVTFLDVGQGDATLVQTADGWSMLVDAGGGQGRSPVIGERVLVPALWALSVRRLDVAVVTHGGPDHAGGLGAVLRDVRPDEVWEGIPVPGHSLLTELRERADAASVRWRPVVAGHTWERGLL